MQPLFALLNSLKLEHNSYVSQSISYSIICSFQKLQSNESPYAVQSSIYSNLQSFHILLPPTSKRNFDLQNYQHSISQQFKVMENKQETHPNKSNLDFFKLKATKLKIQTHQSSISIRNSSLHFTISGSRNRIKIEDSAGRITIEGSQNRIEIKKSWIACQIQGGGNVFELADAQFQLQRHQGVHNFIPGVIGEHPLRFANRLLINQGIQINLRQNMLKQNSKTIKKYWPNLIKSKYQSEVRECPICYDDIKPGDEVTAIFCFHYFHSICIEACLQTTTKCPVCSLELLQFIKEQIAEGNYICKENQLLMKESMEEENQ